ncbi:hypothetical protein FIBSPDRAFT_893019 [Athelia psychrophila]|uniref:Uncharacterized protein n=1 Tax=Athelia psychrophila TaxID=1759441 RepID=A0A166HM06_9AGAM|nr:hypothetical protein FIBSPDRAFT_893019 [Fibularhizoctonia sp. CBS 109695]
MGQNLLSIRILFHATFAFVYLPIIGLGFTGTFRNSFGQLDTTFVHTHFDGITALSALVGLGIFAALDILTIRRTVNQRAFLAIEIIVVPIIIVSTVFVWNNWFDTLFDAICWPPNSNLPSKSWRWICNAIFSMALPKGDVTIAIVIAATAAILALNAVFLSYICITAITDKVRGNNFLPIYSGDPSLSAPGVLQNWYLLGRQKTSTERKAMTSHCTDYIFRNSVFRKHAFEPTIWAIFRGIIAIYACASLVAFSAFSELSEAQQRQILTVSETISMVAPYEMLRASFPLSVASFLTAPTTPGDIVWYLNPEQNPLPTLSVNTTNENDWQNPTPGFWTAYDIDNFNVSWTGEYSLLTWVTSNGGQPATTGTGSFNSTQVNSTNPLVLAPFRQYHISLIAVKYLLPNCSFTQWIPDVLFVDGVSGSDASMAIFSFNGYQNQILTREFSRPSIFSSMAHVLSNVGGTLSFIDGLFALILGRTIIAIIFGTRIVSPFGLLGMVTHNRFKRLIHEQFPRMQEDIDHGGMAAYISEVAIDAALIDKPSAQGHTGSAESSFMGDETGEANAVGLRHMPVGSSASYLRLPYIVEELGDLESNQLVARKIDDE